MSTVVDISRIKELWILEGAAEYAIFRLEEISDEYTISFPVGTTVYRPADRSSLKVVFKEFSYHGFITSGFAIMHKNTAYPLRALYEALAFLSGIWNVVLFEDEVELFLPEDPYYPLLAVVEGPRDQIVGIMIPGKEDDNDE